MGSSLGAAVRRRAKGGKRGLWGSHVCVGRSHTESHDPKTESVETFTDLAATEEQPCGRPRETSDRPPPPLSREEVKQTSEQQHRLRGRLRDDGTHRARGRWQVGADPQGAAWKKLEPRVRDRRPRCDGHGGSGSRFVIQFRGVLFLRHHVVCPWGAAGREAFHEEGGAGRVGSEKRGGRAVHARCWRRGPGLGCGLGHTRFRLQRLVCEMGQMAAWCTAVRSEH